MQLQTEQVQMILHNAWKANAILLIRAVKENREVERSQPAETGSRKSRHRILRA